MAGQILGGTLKAPVVSMELSPELITEYQDIIEREYGVKLTEDEAIVQAQRLIFLYEIIAHPLPSEKGAAPQNDDASSSAPPSSPHPGGGTP